MKSPLLRCRGRVAVVHQAPYRTTCPKVFRSNTRCVGFFLYWIQYSPGGVDGVLPLDEVLPLPGVLNSGPALNCPDGWLDNSQPANWLGVGLASKQQVGWLAGWLAATANWLGGGQLANLLADFLTATHQIGWVATIQQIVWLAGYSGQPANRMVGWLAANYPLCSRALDLP